MTAQQLALLERDTSADVSSDDAFFQWANSVWSEKPTHVARPKVLSWVESVEGIVKSRSAVAQHLEPEMKAKAALVERYVNALRAQFAPTDEARTLDREAHQVFETLDVVPLADPPPLLAEVPPPQPRPHVFRALQEWEGRVDSILNDTFVGVLIDKTAGEKIESERAEFLLDDVSLSDRVLLRVGAIFRWVIGYQKLQGGTVQRVSQIVFRRLPAWRQSEIEKAKDEGRAMMEALRARAAGQAG